MKKDALDAHAREELGLTATNSARPLQAALFSAGAFLPVRRCPHRCLARSRSAGFVLYYSFDPVITCGPGLYILGGEQSQSVRAIIRITFWSTMAMVLSMGIGHLAGQALF
jgi:hypothetical protein